MKIAVGTKSKQKILFLQEILDELEIIADLEPFDVSSGISDQPKRSKETKLGSVNRAKQALALSPDSDFSLGIEIGYRRNLNGKYKILCWTTLIDKVGKQISAQSHKLVLPSFHQKILKENKYLGDFVRQYLEENPDPVSQHIGIIIRDRKPFIQTSIKLALLNYLVK
jgi:inosine/xanthosine triphosphatase